MGLLDEIDNYATRELGITFNEYRLINIGGKLLYVEGHTGINVLGEKEISLHLKKRLLTIKGEGLSIKYFDKKTAYIVGRIVEVVVL